MGQTIDNALVESPHRVVVESPHRTKCGNGLRESIVVRGGGIYVQPGICDAGDVSWMDTLSDVTLGYWRDGRALSDGGAALGDSGCVSFYETYLAQLDSLTLTDDWTEDYQVRDIGLSASTPPGVHDTTSSVDTVWSQNTATQNIGFNYQAIQYLKGAACAGWTINHEVLMIGREQARYAGGRSKIPYWSGRYQDTYEVSGTGTELCRRIDCTGGGWHDVVDGELLVTVPYSGVGSPFPLTTVSNTLRTGFMSLQAVTRDLNFVMLGTDASTCSQEWGMPFGVWCEFAYNTPLP